MTLVGEPEELADFIVAMLERFAPNAVEQFTQALGEWVSEQGEAEEPEARIGFRPNAER